MYIPKIGEKILNKGDMANRPHWLEVIGIEETKFGTDVKVKVIQGGEGVKQHGYVYAIQPCMIYDKDNGTYATRFVTERAYKEWKEEQDRRTKEYIEKLRNQRA